jgi:hypothetical protein
MVQDSRSTVLRHAQIRDEQSGDDLLKSAKWSSPPIAVVSSDTLHAQARNRFPPKKCKMDDGRRKVYGCRVQSFPRPEKRFRRLALDGSTATL